MSSNADIEQAMQPSRKWWIEQRVIQASTDPSVHPRVQQLIVDLWKLREAARLEPVTVEQIKHMVERFLQWQLPKSFNPDGGIVFDRYHYDIVGQQMEREPVGTNLFDYTQATEMVRHMVEGWPDSASSAEADAYEIGHRDGYEEAIQQLDLLTGGDGEFKGSAIPGETVDVPAMRQRIIDRFTSVQGEDDLPFRRHDIKRGLILFRTSNNAHGHTNFVSLTSKVKALPQAAKEELAQMMRNIASDLAAPVSAGQSKSIDDRLAALEKVAHVPFDFSDLIARLEAVEKSVRTIFEGRRAAQSAPVQTKTKQQWVDATLDLPKEVAPSSAIARDLYRIVSEIERLPNGVVPQAAPAQADDRYAVIVRFGSGLVHGRDWTDESMTSYIKEVVFPASHGYRDVSVEIVRADVAPTQQAPISGGVEAIATERRRQIEVEGWTAEHDDQHDGGQMARAGAGYAFHAGLPDDKRALGLPQGWPAGWSFSWWRPSTRRRDLVKAGALIAAEIDRLDRVTARNSQKP